MNYYFDELSSESRFAALDAYWQKCLAGPDADSYIADFHDIAADCLSDFSSYFSELTDASLSVDYTELAYAIRFSDPWGHTGLWMIDFKPENCIGSDTAIETARAGVPIDDIEWDFVLPDPDAFDFDYAAFTAHMNWTLACSERNLDTLCATARSLDDFLSGVWLEFYSVCRIATDLILEDRRPAILNDLTEILEPELSALGPVFNEDGFRLDGSRSDYTN